MEAGREGRHIFKDSATDVLWMIGFGFLGYFLRQYDYPMGPMILGMILGPLMDLSFRRALITVHGSYPALFLDLVSHPISLSLTLFIVLALYLQARRNRAAKREQAASNGAE